MKKAVVLFLIFNLIMTLCACGIKKEESVTVKDADLYSEYKIDQTAISEKDDFSKDGVVVAVGDITYEDVVTKINLNIENNREEKITVIATELSVNGLMCNDSLMVSMEPSSKSDNFIEISNQWFGEMNIETISDIEFVIKAFNEKDEEILKSDTLKIKTDASWTYKQEYDEGGHIIYKDNDITLSAREVKKSKLSEDYELVFFAENNTKGPISIMSEEVSVNGKAIEPLFVMTIGAGKKCVDSMLFYKADLDELEIKEIKKVKASFKAFDGNLKTVFEIKGVEVPIK